GCSAATRAPRSAAAASASTPLAPLRWMTACPGRQSMPDANAAIASSGTARKTVSQRAATSAGVTTTSHPGIAVARLAARSVLRPVTATTGIPTLANSRASVVPTAPAPTKPTLPSAERESGDCACTDDGRLHKRVLHLRTLVQILLEQAAGLRMAQFADRAF